MIARKPYKPQVLEEQKGFDRLIRCWQKIAQEYPDWKV